MRLSYHEDIGPRLSSTLDLSRWVAAALVLLFHVRINLLVDPAEVDPLYAGLWSKTVFVLMTCGAQAVIGFFVISGFLVGGSVISDIRRDRFDFGRYFVNRVSRLYVVLLPALIVGYALDEVRIFLYGISVDAGDETTASYSAWTFLANLLSLQTVAAPTLGSNNPLWSLAFEAWYYVLFPLLLAPFMRSRSGAARGVLFLLGVALLIALARNPHIPRMFVIWVLGAAIRFCPFALIRARWLSWTLTVAAVVGYSTLFEVIGRSVNLVVALAFANLLLTAMHAKDVASPVRSAAFHAALAGFSYSLYLVHAPALHFVLALAKRDSEPRLFLQPTGWQPLAIGAGLFGLLVVYGFVFGRMTEAKTPQVRAMINDVLKLRLAFGR